MHLAHQVALNSPNGDDVPLRTYPTNKLIKYQWEPLPLLYLGEWLIHYGCGCQYYVVLRLD